MKQWGKRVGLFLYISNWDWERKRPRAPPDNGFLLGGWEGKGSSGKILRRRSWRLSSARGRLEQPGTGCNSIKFWC